MAPAPRPDQLTDGQRECLRLVYQHMSSKEIARTLGISKATVDQRIDGARRKLGSVSRVEAARLLARHEQGAIPDRILYDPIALSSSSAPRHPTPWPTRTQPQNALSSGQRFVAVVGIALLGLAAAAVLLALMIGIGALAGR